MKLGDHNVMHNICNVFKMFDVELATVHGESLQNIINEIAKLDFDDQPKKETAQELMKKAIDDTAYFHHAHPNILDLTLEETVALVNRIEYSKIGSYDGIVAWGKIITLKRSLENKNKVCDNHE